MALNVVEFVIVFPLLVWRIGDGLRDKVGLGCTGRVFAGFDGNARAGGGSLIGLSGRFHRSGRGSLVGKDEVVEIHLVGLGRLGGFVLGMLAQLSDAAGAGLTALARDAAEKEATMSVYSAKWHEDIKKTETKIHTLDGSLPAVACAC